MLHYLFLKTRIHLIFNLVFSLSWAKIWNGFRNIAAYYLGTENAGNAPSLLLLYLNYSCNYNCIMCQKSSRDANSYTVHSHRYIDFEKLRKFLTDQHQFIAVVRISGGEPFMYPHFEELIDLLNNLKLRYTLQTNGSILPEPILKKLTPNCLNISFSIDSAVPKTYAYMRAGGKLAQVQQNISRINWQKKQQKSKTPFLNVAAACFTFNIDELPQLVQFCYDHKIPSLSLSEGAYYNTPKIKNEHFIRNNPNQIHHAVNRAQRLADKLGITLRLNSPILYFQKEENQLIANRNPKVGCFDYYFTCSITPEAWVKICPLSNPVEPLNLENSGHFWNSPQMQKNRAVLRTNNFPETCRFCPDYNEHYNQQTEYSFIDFQKQNPYWKLNQSEMHQHGIKGDE